MLVREFDVVASEICCVVVDWMFHGLNDVWPASADVDNRSVELTSPLVVTITEETWITNEDISTKHHLDSDKWI